MAEKKRYSSPLPKRSMYPVAARQSLVDVPDMGPVSQGFYAPGLRLPQQDMGPDPFYQPRTLAPQSLGSTIGAMRIPYRTEGRRMSTNVQDLRPGFGGQGQSTPQPRLGSPLFLNPNALLRTELGGSYNTRSAMTPFNPGSIQFAEPFGQRPMDIRTFDAGVSQVVPRTPASPRMQYIPPSPVGQRSPNQPIPAVPQGQRLQLIPAINTGPRNLQESALSVGQFGQLPQSFQQRFQERQASGLNQGFTEQDAVNYYNQNYLSRGRGLQPDAGAVSYGPGAMRPSPQVTQQPVQSQAPSFSGMSLADQLERQRLAGQGMFAGPTPQERGQFNAAVVDRIRQNPSPINQFLGQELMGRTREGRQMGMADLEQGYLSRPMQGGMMRGSTADTMRDRERRLAAFGSIPRDTGAELTQTRMVQDQAINEELARQGITQDDLDYIAEQRNQPGIAQGGRAAMSALRPGTVIRGMGGNNVPFTIAVGREQPSDLRERRLAGLPARQERDRLAVASRLDRMRMGRQAMMANQQAAQRQAMEMATNPIANPMLLAGSPGAQAEAMRLGQQQREFMAGAPIREAQMLEQSLRNQGLMYQNQASRRMLTPEYEAQQRQERALNALAEMDAAKMAAITAIGPDGQRLMQGLYRDAAGANNGQPAGPSAPPTTAVEAQGVVQQLSPSVQAVIGDDPANYNSEELAYKLKQMQDLGMQITPQDIQTINEYSAARTMYDTRFATAGRSRASRMWERVTSP